MKVFNLIQKIQLLAEKKSRLKNLDNFDRNSLDNWLQIELTYTSNAIEGNTLTHQETMLVVEEGLSIPGKKVYEIQEAKNHYQALMLVKKMTSNLKDLKNFRQNQLLEIHQIILAGIDNFNAGKYRSVGVRISGSSHLPPNPLKVPDLMDEMEKKWQNDDFSNPLKLACDLHYELASIHPFTDGNGRSARLLFNLVLLVAGYPLSFISPSERVTYLKSLEKANLTQDLTDYYRLMLNCIERSLDLYLSPETSSPSSPSKLTVNKLAKLSKESESTIRHWTKLGLLPISKGQNNYAYYDESTPQLCRKIRQLQKNQRFNLDEIKQILNP